MEVFFLRREKKKTTDRETFYVAAAETAKKTRCGSREASLAAFLVESRGSSRTAEATRGSRNTTLASRGF